jgi:hypothetical protein
MLYSAPKWLRLPEGRLDEVQNAIHIEPSSNVDINNLV